MSERLSHAIELAFTVLMKGVLGVQSSETEATAMREETVFHEA